MTIDPATITSLRSRLEALTGPDREVDLDLWQALCWRDHYNEIAKGTPLTASVDAALALVARVLPDARRRRNVFNRAVAWWLPSDSSDRFARLLILSALHEPAFLTSMESPNG